MLAILSLLVTIASSAAIPAPNGGYISFDIHNQLAKRSLPNINFTRPDYYLLVDLDVGSTHQEAKVVFDTGSSNTWFSTSVYNPHLSSTWHNASKPLSIGYVGGSTRGFYGSDQVKVHGTDYVLQNVTLGTASAMPGIKGIIGAGPLTDDPNSFLRKLKSTGYIDTIAFGVWLNSEDGENGKITLGGIDATKYKGTLQKIPWVNIPSKNADGTWDYHENAINNVNSVFNKISIQNGAGESLDVVTGAALPACFDTGTYDVWLPKQWYLDIAEAFGARWDPRYNQSVTDTKPQGGSITINFSGVDIVMDLTDLWVEEESDGKKEYRLEMNPVDGPISIEQNLIFGNTFMRYAYIVFDYENREFAIAPAAPEASLTSTSDIKPIGATGIDAPKATGFATSTYNTEFTYAKPTFSS